LKLILEERDNLPFPRTWSEELIVEWLQTKGYLVEVDVHAGSTKKGGRFQADVVGVGKNEHGEIEIFHIEIGSIIENYAK
jgi:hypothetical protein